MSDKRIILLTGNGKGKTSSAIGMVLRAVGHDMHVCLIHFIKSTTVSGETRALRHLPRVEQHICGLGFVKTLAGATFQKHVEAANECLAMARAKLLDATYHMVVLDEVCVAIALGLLAEQDIVDAVVSATPGKIVILTGRSASNGLIQLADTVSNIESVKHAFDAGGTAHAGVEF